MTRRYFYAFLPVLAGIVSCWRVAFEPGVVGLVHDWNIYPFAAQHIELAREIFDGWFRWQLGAPIAYPTEYPLRFLFAGFAVLGMSGAILSKFAVFAFPAAACASAMLLARTLRTTDGGAALCGVFYALNPVMLNKLVSGQLSYLFGFASLPLVLAAAVIAAARGRILRGGLAIGAALALAFAQIQLGLCACGLLVLAIAFSPKAAIARRAALAAVAFAVTLLIHAPTIYGLRHAAPRLVTAVAGVRADAWLGVNSVAPLDSARLVGYLMQYDVKAAGDWLGPWSVVAWIVVGAVVGGLVAAPRPLRIYAGVVALAALLFAGGTKTWFAAGQTWLFFHVPAMQVFRELYHVVGVVALIYAVALAYCYGAIRGRFVTFGKAAMWALILMYVAPMTTGDAGGWLRAFTYDADLAPAFSAQENRAGRILWTPIDQPLAFDRIGYGNDPMAVNARGSVWDYSLRWPLTAFDDVLRFGNGADLRRSLAEFGVGDVVERDRFTSRLPLFVDDGEAARAYFSGPVSIGNRLPLDHIYSPTTRSYRLDGNFAALVPVRSLAIVPRRLSAIAAAEKPGVAAIAFGDSVPPGVPYVVAADQADGPEESALLLSSGRSLLAPQAVDPWFGFAPISSWWWFRHAYADVPAGLVALGSQHMRCIAPQAISNGRLVVAWVSTAAGGHVRVSAAGRSTTIDTRGGEGVWHSRSIALAALPSGGAIDVDALDSGRQVALRDLKVLSRLQFAAATERYRHLLAGARAPSRVTQARKGYLALFREGYDDGWRVAGAEKHFSSALGQNLFLLRDGSAFPTRAWNVHEPRWHAVFFLGTATLLVCLVELVLLFRIERVRPAWR